MDFFPSYESQCAFLDTLDYVCGVFFNFLLMQKGLHLFMDFSCKKQTCRTEISSVKDKDCNH